MNAVPMPLEAASPTLTLMDEDAYDDSYAWVGYESALPLSFSGADHDALPAHHAPLSAESLSAIGAVPSSSPPQAGE